MSALLRRCLVALGCAVAPVCAYAEPVLNFSGGTRYLIASNDASVGWSFTTKREITVVALDAYDPSLSGSVRLYDGSGAILAAATVLLTDPKEGTGIQFYSHAIIPVVLAANTEYFVAQDAKYDPQVTSKSTSFYGRATSLNVDPAIVYGHAVIGAFGGVPTSDVFAGALSPGFFGPDFDVEPAIAVPEPTALALLGTALAGLCFSRRRADVR